MSKIIALVDGSVYSESVCDHAAWVATRKGAAVEVLHILGRREGARGNLSGAIGLGARSKLLEELSELDEQQARLNLVRGHAILEDAEARLRAAGVAEVITRLRRGDLVEELQVLEKDAYLVVVGKRGEAADFATLHLGSNLERVVRASTRPALVCARAFRPITRFTIAFDGGASALKAVEHVAQGPVFKGLSCRLLTIGENTPKARRLLEGAAALLRAAGYEVEAEILPGQPEAVIGARVTEGLTDMLVMGAYGHSRIRSLIIGSTTTQMIRSCQVPLMLFR